MVELRRCETEGILDSAEEFIVFALFMREIVVREVSISLLELAFDLVPFSFHFELVHTRSSFRMGGVRVSLEIFGTDLAGAHYGPFWRLALS